MQDPSITSYSGLEKDGIGLERLKSPADDD